MALPRRLLDTLGVIPSYYLRYFYAHDIVLDEQLDGVPRAAAVAEIERHLLELYRDPSVDEKPALLEQRGGAFYSEAATGLVASLVSGSSEVHEVDIRNNGTLAGLADDDVVEVPATIVGGVPVPLPQEPLAPELLGLAQHVAAYERLAVGAALSGNPADVRKALLAHPLIGQWEATDELVDRLLAADAAQLPRFAGSQGAPRMSGPLILAVDGGNSKTYLALLRADGALLALVRGTQSSPHHLGGDGCLTVLDGLLGDAARSRRHRDGGTARRGRRVPARGRRLPERGGGDRGALSARGLGGAHDRRATTRSPSCGPEPRTAGASPSSAAPASTASASPATAARFASRRSARSPVTGAAATTSGSPPSAPRPGARTGAARGRRSSRRCRRISASRTPAQLAEAIHRREIPMRAVIGLAPVVFAEAADDAVAAEIVDHLAAEVVNLARVALERLGLTDETVEVMLGGGMFRSRDPRLLGAIDRGLRGVGPGLSARVTDSPPIVGAALLGLDAVGARQRRGATGSEPSSARPSNGSSRARRRRRACRQRPIWRSSDGGRSLHAGDAGLPRHDGAGGQRARPRTSPTASSSSSSARPGRARRRRCGCSPGSRRSTPARS